MSRQLPGVPESYRPRVVDAELDRKLRAVPTVLIEGPRACGKTATASRRAASAVYIDVDTSAQAAAAVNPGLVLDGDSPRLVDEWQIAPELWNHIRRASDFSQEPGRFILTGSAVPPDDLTRHTGAGRVSRIRMRPMSLYEMGVSTGEVSLADLWESTAVSAGAPSHTFDDLVELACRGGWPGSLDLGLSEAQQFTRSYLNEVRRTDISRVDGVQRDPRRVWRVLQAIARNVATEVSERTLTRDISGAEGTLSRSTLRGYLDALERLHVIEDQPAWTVHLRSKSQLRQMSKRHFADPSLAVAALNAGPRQLRADLELFGFLFESLVVRDLRVYAQAHDAEIYHYRDNTGLEIDVVVEAADGGWFAAEIKLGGEKLIEEGVSALLKFRDRVDTSRKGHPTKLMVITSGGYGYERADGVAVIPIGALAP